MLFLFMFMHSTENQQKIPSYDNLFHSIKETTMTIGKTIYTLRKKQHLTQKQLAELLGITYQAVSNWELGKNDPDLDQIKRLTTIFGVSADILLGLTEPEL